jgi:hypothetical protein
MGMPKNIRYISLDFYYGSYQARWFVRWPDVL